MMWKSASTPASAEGAAGGSAQAPASLAIPQKPANGAPVGKKLAVLLVAGLVLAGGGVGAAKFLGEGSGRRPAKAVEPLLTHEFADIIVNIDETRITHVLKCTLHVEVNDSKALNELKLREVVYRDAIIEILQSKTLADVEGTGPNAIKREIRDRFNKLMKSGSVVEVYYKEFIAH